VVELEPYSSRLEKIEGGVDSVMGLPLGLLAELIQKVRD
jgi:predicted house-cleaning NTP pyrophosphatase (Maf/HAM1 superfamily)